MYVVCVYVMCVGGGGGRTNLPPPPQPVSLKQSAPPPPPPAVTASTPRKGWIADLPPPPYSGIKLGDNHHKKNGIFGLESENKSRKSLF